MWSREQQEEWDRIDAQQKAAEYEKTGTASKRYRHRLGLFEADGKPLPKLRHHAHWLLHNCVAHPLLAFFPGEKTTDLHQLSSKWLNRLTYFDYAEIPEPKDRKAWILHNLVAHMAIGLVPCEATFAFHDATAEAMNVPGWV